MNQIPYEKRVKTYTNAIITYGMDKQMAVAIEELSECQKEICKILRGEGDLGHLAEEIADATIMLEQLRLMFGLNEKVCRIMDYKVERLDRKLSGEKFVKPFTDPLGKQSARRKAMLSQPMAGKTDEEIVVTREKAISELQKRGYREVNTLFTDEWYSKEAMESRGVVQIPLCFLAKSLENMSLCHAAYFCKGWENARGCRIEHEAAVAYGLEIIYEE